MGLMIYLLGALVVFWVAELVWLRWLYLAHR